MRISLLVHHVYGVGGTNRTVINLAEELSRRHHVQIVSVLRRLDRPVLEIPDRVSVIGLVDLRKGGRDVADPRARELSEVVPPEEEFYRFYSRLTDLRVADYLRRTGSDVVVGTRSAINLYVARLGRAGTVRIAQEHMTQDMIPQSVHEQMRLHYPRLSAVTTVTEADAGAVRAVLGPDAPPVLAIPNSVPEPRVARADGTSRIVVAAGRLDEIKRYDLLVRAFARVVDERPEWTLRIYGSGGQSRPLAALIADLDLHNHVFLMGACTPVETEWVKGSIAAVTSDRESFGMTIVEAMRCGLAVVSTACPVGPAEIIQDGVDGLLVPPGNVEEIAGALLRLMNDDELRRRLGATAVLNAERYDPRLIAERYEQLFRSGPPVRSRTPRQVVAGLATPVRWASTRGRHALARIVGPRIVGSRLLRADALAPPTADCRMADGQVLLSLNDPFPVRRPTHLVFRPRRIDPAPEPLRVPLVDAGASFPADSALLAEGRWDLFLADRRGALRRLRAGFLDVRGLLGGCAETAPFARNVPYRTADGFLAVAAWQRPLHAEAGDISYGAETITVTGRLIAGEFGAVPPTLTLTRRGEHPATIAVPGKSSGAADFRAEIPVSRLAALRVQRHEDWDVAVGVGDGGAQIPVARLMDDIIERKKIFAYPPMRVDEDIDPELYDEAPYPELSIKPYLSIQSGLTFLVSDRPI